MCEGQAWLAQSSKQRHPVSRSAPASQEKYRTRFKLEELVSVPNGRRNTPQARYIHAPDNPNTLPTRTTCQETQVTGAAARNSRMNRAPPQADGEVRWVQLLHCLQQASRALKARSPYDRHRVIQPFMGYVLWWVFLLLSREQNEKCLSGVRTSLGSHQIEMHAYGHFRCR